MMVMRHNEEARCPYCMSRKLEVIDHDLANPKYHDRFGKFWFKLKCQKCGGTCEDINNLETAQERRHKKELRKRMEGNPNEAIQVHGEY